MRRAEYTSNIHFALPCFQELCYIKRREVAARKGRIDCHSSMKSCDELFCLVLGRVLVDVDVSKIYSVSF